MTAQIFQISAFTPVNGKKQCFLDRQVAEEWKDKQPNKDELQVIECGASSQELPDLKNIYCVLNPDPYSSIN